MIQILLKVVSVSFKLQLEAVRTEKCPGSMFQSLFSLQYCPSHWCTCLELVNQVTSDFNYQCCFFLITYLPHIVDGFVQCGQGSTDDELSATCVSALLGIQIEAVAAGLWHTICISTTGDVYSFGGNQFGQLGTGSDQAEVRLFINPTISII